MNTKQSTSSVAVIIPAYNESQVIGDVLAVFSELPYEIIVIDDGSSDTTISEIENYPVWLLQHATNLGQGAALQTGFEFALSLAQVEYFITFDSDGQHNAGDIETIVNILNSSDVDVVLGSRFCEGGIAENIKGLKKFVLKLAINFTNWQTGLKLTDTHNGIRGFRREALAKIHLKQNRMAHASELLNQISANQMKVQEIPVHILYTEYSMKKGQSLLNGINILWDLFIGK
jgi:glycosyltransferase involved in cell wall biosynthesis